MADRDDRDTSLSGRSNAGAGRGSSPGGPSISGNNSNSHAGGIGSDRNASSTTGSGSHTGSNSNAGGNNSNAGNRDYNGSGGGSNNQGRNDTPSSGNPSFNGGNNNNNNNNVTARSGTAGVGSDWAASATVATPGAYGFRAHGNSAQTARADTPSSAQPVASGRDLVSAMHTTPADGFGRTSVAGARADTPSSYQPVGSDLASTMPDFMRGVAAPPSRMTAPASGAVSRFSPTPTGLTPQDIARQAATLTTTLPGRLAQAPATAAGIPALTTRTKMDQMEERAIALTSAPPTSTPYTPRGLGAPVAAGTPTAGYDPATPVHPDSLPSSVNPVGNMSMEVGGPTETTVPPVAGDRPIGGPFYGSNLTSPARLGYDTASQPPGTIAGLEMQDSPSAYGTPLQEGDRQIAGATTPQTLGDFQTASADIRSTVPAQTQTAAATGPIGVDVLNNPADLRAQYARAQYTPAAGAIDPTQVAGVQTPSTAPTPTSRAAADEPAVDDGYDEYMNPDVPATDDGAPVDDNAPENGPPTEADVVVEDNAPATIEVSAKTNPNTLRQVVKDVLTPNKKGKPRGLLGDTAVIAGDVGIGLINPLAGLFNTGVQVVTGKSIPGHIWAATHGEYGENMYRGSEHLNDGGGNRDQMVNNGGGNNGGGGGTTVPPVTTPTTTALTFEEKYLNDNTFRPTPEQVWGPNPTYFDYA